MDLPYKYQYMMQLDFWVFSSLGKYHVATSHSAIATHLTHFVDVDKKQKFLGMSITHIKNANRQ